MIECIFTLDYEIYGNGEGSLRELVYEPAQKIKTLFDRAGAKLVVFVEAAELEVIASYQTDSAIRDVEDQIRELFNQGHEIALHLHPQWCNARCQNGKWNLDYNEYNLCTLPPQRIAEIVDQSTHYLRNVLKAPAYTPLSFRAGNWLFQPTQPAASILWDRGVRIDSSVFKGGLQRQHHLDYRRAVNNGDYWRFKDRVEVPDPRGDLLEIPIYTQMVHFWKMATVKRIGLQQKAASETKTTKQKIYRLLDMARFRQPLKLDFCRMTIGELTGMMNRIIKDDRQTPQSYEPIVAIGHTKDLVDFETVQSFLAFLQEKGIAISTFRDIYEKWLTVDSYQFAANRKP